jgi:hypothetical protein
MGPNRRALDREEQAARDSAAAARRADPAAVRGGRRLRCRRLEHAPGPPDAASVLAIDRRCAGVGYRQGPRRALIPIALAYQCSLEKVAS